ncbi:hypothetical protein EPC75_07985 [Helicobacter pylori]|nr:hypothetical protein EPC73_07565 [Helicobacter pylori]KAA6504038.1 hypothetical protein EPC78_04130 [Helicobacter pylori]KAA6516896.1 hypothetical protein EPC75_07985 [Helicobacter pylori]
MFNCYSEILLMFFYGLHYPYNFILCFVFSINSYFFALACSSGLKFVASLVVSFKFSVFFNKSS